ncbi:MAG: phosphoribosylformylglycinamidine synthase subunit PurS [Deltaproteobacteria bacterium]|jgi:phosphoribosylformylglycinamidine synthase|nr:phosphoribosylformylglycinamidine synthase subunit PurS [Deltaproteobacteria bacterium]
MKYQASVKVMLKASVLDPQGSALERALASMGHKNVLAVRVGKIIELILESPSLEEAQREASQWADNILANPNMESFTISVKELKLDEDSLK